MADKDWKFNPITGTMEPVNPLTHGLGKQVDGDGGGRKRGLPPFQLLRVAVH